MERATLLAIVKATPGVTADKAGRFTVDSEYRVSLYLGKPGAAMELDRVEAIVLNEEVCRVLAGPGPTHYFLAYDAVHALSALPPEVDSRRSAGFS